MISRVTRLRFPLTLLLCTLCLPPPAAAWLGEPGYVPVRRSLPTAIDLMESGLYWMQDLSGVDDPRDPASIIALMEDQMARFFDFAHMSYLVGGPAYARLDAMERSHFQNRVRDRLFSMLAKQMGMYNVRMPRFHPLVPTRTGSYTWTMGGMIYHPGGPNIRLLFYFYLSPRGWRIYDVSSNGVSAVRELRRRHHKELFDR